LTAGAAVVGRGARISLPLEDQSTRIEPVTNSTPRQEPSTDPFWLYAEEIRRAERQILADAERELDLDPRELKLRLEMHLREEFADLTQQIAADRGGHDG
jgi:hypothetical protein